MGGKPSAIAHDWEGEGDARALMSAHEIKRDPKRLARAKKHLGRLHKEHLGKMAAAKAAAGTTGEVKKKAGQYLKMSKKQPYC